MRETVKSFLERTTPLGHLARSRRYRRFRKQYLEWKRCRGVPPMPHYGKWRVVMTYASRFRPPVFVETGTYTGHMVYGTLNSFEEIYSVELDYVLAEKARRKFAGYRHIHIIQGDSSEVLPAIVRTISVPCLFWLDAHYSGGHTARGELETPIMRELPCILNHPLADKHLLLIVDARCFTGKNDYPSLKTLEQFILDAHPGWFFYVKDDIIRTYSKRV